MRTVKLTRMDRYASWEISQELHLLGFDEATGRVVDNPNNRIFYPDPCETDNCAVCGRHKDEHTRGFKEEPFFCETTRVLQTPTLSQAIDWLRENKDIYIEVQLDQTSDPKFCISIVEYVRYMAFEKHILPQEKWGLYRNYYEAQKVGIEEALRIIKNKK